MKILKILILLNIIVTFTIFSKEYSIENKIGIKIIKTNENKVSEKNKVKNIEGNQEIFKLYNEIGLEKKMSYTTFYSAIKGFRKIEKNINEIITIVDFTKSSLEQRGYVIDLKNKKLLYSTYVMHGKNSGDDIANDFSNVLDSYKSSPGFYLTEDTYFGQFGYSLVLNGLEKGINDLAKERKIVMHGSKYAKPIKGASMLSKSLGCPAIPIELVKPVINKIKGGSVFYIHTELEEYINKSKLI